MKQFIAAAVLAAIVLAGCTGQGPATGQVVAKEVAAATPGPTAAIPTVEATPEPTVKVGRKIIVVVPKEGEVPTPAASQATPTPGPSATPTPAPTEKPVELRISQTTAVVTPCLEKVVSLNVVNAPPKAEVTFQASTNGNVQTSFNPAVVIAGSDGFAETRLRLSAGCASTGSAAVTAFAKICANGLCEDEETLIQVIADHCEAYEVGCDVNGSIGG